MIEYTTGNILNSTCKALVNTVNCEGYMGKGIAYQFKLKFPKNNDVYATLCGKGAFRPGDLLIVEEDKKLIINFPTKDKWRKKSEYKFIEDGLSKLQKEIESRNILSIAVPPLGCGNGGLEWGVVKQLLIKYLEPVQEGRKIVLYEPFTHPTKLKNPKPKKQPKINASHLMLMLMKMKLEEFKFNKIRLQKTAYLTNIISGTEYFRFDKNHFGPYAYSIDILSRQIKEYQDYHSVSTLDAYRQGLQTMISQSVLNKLENFRKHLDRTISIVNDIPEDSNIELLATLIFLIEGKKELSIDEMVLEVHNWSERKKESFNDYVIENMTHELEKLGIIRMSLLKKYELSGGI